VDDTLYLIRALSSRTTLPISALISPTVMRRNHLIALKDAGAERIGIAVDAANPDLFEMLRGRGVDGPHRWSRYWELFEQAIEIFGRGMVGIHLIVGLGEQEMEMARLFQQIRDEGGCTHLFSFFPEANSALEKRPQAPAPSFRRLQMARWLIDEGIIRYESFSGDILGRIISFGLDTDRLEEYIRKGVAFVTSGCPDECGNVACNRPYGDSPPGDDIRSFPFLPNKSDIARIRRELATY
jgi:biotin synthase